MSLDRRVLLTDLGIAAVPVVNLVMLTGTVTGRSPAWALALGLVSAGATAGLFYAFEHHLPVGQYETRTKLLVSAGAAVGVLALAALSFVALPAAAGMWAALLAAAGMGSGFGLYRVYFGVVRPIPEARVERERSSLL